MQYIGLIIVSLRLFIEIIRKFNVFLQQTCGPTVPTQGRNKWKTSIHFAVSLPYDLYVRVFRDRFQRERRFQGDFDCVNAFKPALGELHKKHPIRLSESRNRIFFRHLVSPNC